MEDAASISNQLSLLVEKASPLLRERQERLTGESMGPGKWTLLELLGHLIDSAANNHQRFVRALLQSELTFPGYHQVEFVAVQRYAEANSGALIDLWVAYNRHIVWVIAGVPPEKYDTRCIIGDSSTTLLVLASDYVAHLEHHLKQLLGPDALPWSALSWPPASESKR